MLRRTTSQDLSPITNAKAQEPARRTTNCRSLYHAVSVAGFSAGPLASLPLVVATGLWVWIDELVSRLDDEKVGRRTLVIDFGPHSSGRYGVLALVMLLLATLLVGVFSASVSPLALVTLLLGGLAWRIVTESWTKYSCPVRMLAVRRIAFVLHLVICVTVAVSSLLTQLG